MRLGSFLLVVLFSIVMISCSSKKDETELYNKAKKSLNDQNYYDALVSYKELIKEYPNGEHAPEVLLEIGKLYHGKVDTSLTPKESFEKAVEFYKRLQEEYPQNEKASEALFMASFVLANEIKDYKRAEDSYKLFIEKYPESELVESAKIELENIGVAPEEILKKKVTTEK